MKQDVWESIESANDVFICACVCFPFFQEVAEPLQDLKEGMEQLEKNKTLRYILSTLLSIGNFLNGTNVRMRIHITVFFYVIRITGVIVKKASDLNAVQWKIALYISW